MNLIMRDGLWSLFKGNNHLTGESVCFGIIVNQIAGVPYISKIFAIDRVQIDTNQF